LHRLTIMDAWITMMDFHGQFLIKIYTVPIVKSRLEDC
jgi:hypothetical protein